MKYEVFTADKRPEGIFIVQVALYEPGAGVCNPPETACASNQAFRFVAGRRKELHEPAPDKTGPAGYTDVHQKSSAVQSVFSLQYSKIDEDIVR
jgi:hypothetical protein